MATRGKAHWSGAGEFCQTRISRMKMSHQRISLATTQRIQPSILTSLHPLISSTIHGRVSGGRKDSVVVRGLEGERSGESLESQFSKYLLENEISESKRSPSHLMSPVAVVAAQMNALQRNDWPEANAGIKTAFEFSKLCSQSNTSVGDKRVRTWFAEEKWLTYEEFAQLFENEPYTNLVDFDEWEAISEMVFPSRRKDVAVQAVKIKNQDPQNPTQKKQVTYTFCLERILEGSYHNCWMTVGVRLGNYSM